jgi:hypothetical protein
MTIYDAIVVLQLAFGDVNPRAIMEFVNDAALSPAQLNDKTWMDGFHHQCLIKAQEAARSWVEQQDLHQANNRWLTQWPCMNPEVRSNISAGVFGCLHTMCTGATGMLLSQDINLSPDVMDQGKWVLINMPVHSSGASGLVTMAAWKFATQRYVLRRSAGDNTPPVVIWADEYQNVANAFDAGYIAEARKHHGCLVSLTQTISSFFTALKDDPGGNKTKKLLGNFAFKIVHQLADHDSAEFCTKLCGRDKEYMLNGRPSPRDPHRLLLGDGEFSGGFNEHYENLLQERILLGGGLRTGGPPDYCADAVCIKSGIFSNGRNFKIVAFSQK